MKDALPEGWAKCLVEDVFRSFSGGTPSKAQPAYWSGAIPWLSSSDIKAARIKTAGESITQAGLDNSSARLCRAGSVVVVVRSGILKHTLPVGVLEHVAAINQDIKCFDCGNDQLNKWLDLALRASARQILAQNREGTTVQSVKYETLKKLEIRVPPLAEQRRAMAKVGQLIGTVEACQQRLAKVPALLTHFRQSALAAACSGRLTADWREKRQISLEDWTESKLVDVLAEPLANGRSVVDAAVGFPVLRLTCLKNGRIDLSERKIGAWTKEAAKQFLVRKGDFFVSRGSGSLTHIGRGGLVEHDPGDVAYPDTLIRVRVRKDVIEPTFLQRAWSSRAVRDQIESAAHTTAGIWKISQKDLESFVLPIPSTPEQREVVRRVEALFAIADQIERRVAEAQLSVNKLTSSVLAKAFGGELVPTEAELARREGRDFEPASALLDRVRNERNSEAGQSVHSNPSNAAGKVRRTVAARRRPVTLR